MENARKIVKNIIVAVATIAICVTVQAQETKLAEGEILYRGTTKLEKCDQAIISFTLSAEKDTLKNFSIELKGIYIKSNGSLRKVDSKSTYSAAVAVKDGVMDYTYPWRGDNWQIKIKTGLGTETVTGEIKCVYIVSDNQIEDLGTAPIEFKKVETTQK